MCILLIGIFFRDFTFAFLSLSWKTPAVHTQLGGLSVDGVCVCVQGEVYVAHHFPGAVFIPPIITFLRLSLYPSMPLTSFGVSLYAKSSGKIVRWFMEVLTGNIP